MTCRLASSIDMILNDRSFSFAKKKNQLKKKSPSGLYLAHVAYRLAQGPIGTHFLPIVVK